MTVIVWWIEDKFCYNYATGYWKVVQDRTECSSHNSPSEAGELAEYSWFRYSKCKGLLGKWWTFHLPNYRGNWDKDILPSYRTSDRKTLSLHLFNMYAILDRVVFPLKTMKARLITLNLQSLFHECLSKSNLCRSCALLSQHP